MKSSLTRIICRFIAVALVMLPFQYGHAGMIGTDQAVAAASAQADRTAVLSYLSRAQTATELQSLGLDANEAQARVAAMTDAEVSTLAGQMHAVPAGADGGIVLLVLVVFFIWYFAFRK